MAPYTDDRAIVIAHQSGDAEAFNALVREYRPRLVTRAHARLRCRDAAEDAVQETLVRALRALPRFNGEYMLGPWLQRILDNVCYDESKRLGRERAKAERLSGSPDYNLFDDVSPEDDLQLDVDNTELLAAFMKLPANYQEALRLRVVDELPYPEIAAKTGVTEENARARVSRAAKTLRKALKGVLLLPLIGVVLPLIGKAAAGTALLAVVLSSAGDTPQQQFAPAIAEVVRTQEADLDAGLVTDVSNSDVAPRQGGTTEDLGVTAPAGVNSDNTSTSGISTGGTSTATDAPAAPGVVGESGENTVLGAQPGDADSPAIAQFTVGINRLEAGAPLSIVAYNLAATNVDAADSSRLSLAGAVTLRTADGFIDAAINPASQLLADPIARPAIDDQLGSGVEAMRHALSGVLVIDLPDSTVLRVELSGFVSHIGSPMMVVQGADLVVEAGFVSQVLVPTDAEVSVSEALPLTGDGSFSGAMTIDTRTGKAEIVLQRAA